MKKQSKKRVSIAEQLRQVIQETGRSVRAVAMATGIPQPVLHRFMTGERDLTLSTADKLIEHFGLELRENDEAPNGPESRPLTAKQEGRPRISGRENAI